MQKTRAMQLIEIAHGGKSLQAILTELFAELETQEAVAKRLGISYPTLVDWLDQLGAERTQVRRYSTKVSFPEEPAAVS